jgi:hypothetical protein
MIQRLDADGEELFLQAHTFCKQNTFDTIIVKLIQLYSGLPGQTRLLLQHLKSWTDEYGEPPVNSQAQTTIVELKKLFGSIEERCQELAARTLQGKQEVELLIEIEEFREGLAFF